MFTQKDYSYMQRALDLACKGLKETWPNPLVGAVLIKNGKVVGEGWHQKYGGHHAEVEAIRGARKKAIGSTLYVNLEPCSHFGKTPPCVRAVIDAKIKRVVCAMRDPNPKVSGKGFADLRRAGIRVDVGLMEKEAKELNRVFIKIITTPYPYVVNKVAYSLDGKIACENGKSKWISNSEGREYAHRLRLVADAVLVGSQTVFLDDPLLNVRLVPNPRKHQPMRIILEGKRTIPNELKMFKLHDHQKTVIVSTNEKKLPANIPKGVERWVLPGRKNRVDLKEFLKRLRLEGVHFLLVEGGADIHAAFLGLGDSSKEIITDEIHMVLAPKILGGRKALGPIGGSGVDDPNKAIEFSDIHWHSLGKDTLVVVRPNKKRSKAR